MDNSHSQTLGRCLVGAATAGLALAYCPQAAADPSSLPPEVGYNYGNIETPRVAAMAGALRAWGNSTGALFINPASMAMTRVYHLGAFAQIWPEARRQSYGGAAVDSIVSSSGVAGGIGGSWNLQDPDGIDRTTGDLRFGLSLPIADRFFLGLGGRYLTVKQDDGDRAGPLGNSLASSGLDGGKIVRSFAFDAGATFKLSDEIALGVVGNNLNNPDTGFQPTTIGGGVGYGNEDFTLEVDAVGDFTTYSETKVRAMGGFEYLISGSYPIRLGYRYDDGQGSHALTGGVGYVETQFTAEVAVQRTISGPEYTAVILGFKYHLESAGLGLQTGAGF